ncbi:MAG: hypothetical protein ACRDNH_13990 [Gaiellaceae bacterium]|jgi:hypothetical protein
MREGVRWLVVVLIVLVLIGLIAYARGDEHHRGDDVGALGVAVPSEVS